MACNHDRLKVYKRGPGPKYQFLPYGDVCRKCSRHLVPVPPELPPEARGIKEAKG